MKKGLITLTLAFAGIFFWGCDKQEEATPKTVTATSEEESYPHKPCCVRTQGYWKNHCEDWPGYLDCDDDFYLSGLSYLQVLNTPPAGNAYYILAHQFIAARLNLLYCNDPYGYHVDPKVKWAIDKAKYLFQNYTPNQIGELRGSDELRQKFIYLAGILDQFNNGNKGTPSCDE